MFSKEKRKQLHETFWTEFKSFMNKEANAEGKRIKWLRYPTKIKSIFIRLQVDATMASFSIDIQPKDEGVRQIIWEQLTELKKVLENEMGTDGVWKELAYNESQQEISQVSWTLEGVNIYKEEDKIKIFNFLKDRLISFDRFYCNYSDILILLVN
jgi:hypothetical protein